MSYIVASTDHPKKGTYKMPAGPGHYFGRLEHGNIWGQLPLILFVTTLSNRWALSGEVDRKFGLGDLNREDGKPVWSHETHHGWAADIYVIHQKGLHRQDTVNIASFKDPDSYDKERTKKLMQLIAELRVGFPMIQVIFNDPYATAGLSRIANRPNHDEHVHVLLHGEQTYYNSEEVKRLMESPWGL